MFHMCLLAYVHVITHAQNLPCSLYLFLTYSPESAITYDFGSCNWYDIHFCVFLLFSKSEQTNAITILKSTKEVQGFHYLKFS